MLLMLSCGNNIGNAPAAAGKNIENAYYQEFTQLNADRVPKVHPIEFYMKKIEAYEEEYYGFRDSTMKMSSFMHIASINEVEMVVPGALTFLVCWDNSKGSIYYLYMFDEGQEITDHFFCGQNVFLKPEKQVLMEKTGGNKVEYEAVSVGDFNNDGVNEIALFSQYQNIGRVFCVFGFNTTEHTFDELCLVPVFINFDELFPPVEQIENGFRILEVIDDEFFLELAWNSYVWEPELMRYIKQEDVKR